MDPYAMLKTDHQKVSALFRKLEGTAESAVKERTTLFEELNHELIVHMLVEEAALYPVVKEIEATRPLTLGALEEHTFVKSLLGELASMSVDSEEWTVKLGVLKDNVEHHVTEEEEELFPQSLLVLSEEDQFTLAEHLQQERVRVIAVLEGGSIPVVPESGEPGQLGLR